MQQIAVWKTNRPERAAEAERILRRLRELGAEAAVVGEDASLEHFSALLALGGDGTILYAAQAAIRYSIPLAGVNMGRVGFLSACDSAQDGFLRSLAAGDYQVQPTPLLQYTAQTEADAPAQGICVNDIVIAAVSHSHTADITVSSDFGELQYRGDGVIFSLPNGSTAYNYAAGGAVMVPGLEAVAVTPIAPHKGTVRSVIFPIQTAFQVSIRGSAALYADGREVLLPPKCSNAAILLSDCVLQRITFEGKPFLQKLTDKLWQ
ncbi:MAG: NAD(+)/NADH kinase [Oscillospiraceae bacterium]|nr:NAD(+)/NADH kinase [Oscillospiraceae bacterium]